MFSKRLSIPTIARNNEPSIVTTFFRPLLIALLAGVAAGYFGAIPTIADVLAFGSAITSVSTTMLGFMLAALAVLASINNTHLVKMMRATGHFHDLLVTLFVGSSLFLLCAVCGYLLLFGFTLHTWFLATLIGFHAGALISIFDIGRKFWLVLSSLRADNDLA